MTSMRPEATDPAPSRRELAATWLGVTIVAALLALATYAASDLVLEGFRSLGRS